MARKEEFISLRVSKELRDFLEAKAKKRGVKLSKLIEDELSDTYKTDNAQILNIFSKRKQERPEYWNKFGKSPIAKKFETFISMLFTEFVNPISNDPEYQPVVLLGSIQNILMETINHFDSIPEEHKKQASDYFIKIGENLIDGLTHIRSKNKETQEYIINLKKELVEKASFHFTALAFAKESYNKIKAELEKVRDELIKELKENSKTGA